MQKWIENLDSIEKIEKELKEIKHDYEQLSEMATYDRSLRPELERVERDYEELELRFDQLAKEKALESRELCLVSNL